MAITPIIAYAFLLNSFRLVKTKIVPQKEAKMKSEDRITDLRDYDSMQISMI